MRKKLILGIIIACFSYISLVYTGITLGEYFWVDTISQSLKGFSINSILIVAMIYYFLDKTSQLYSNQPKHLKITASITSFIFSLIMGVGKYFQFYINVDNIVIQFFQYIMIIVVAFGFFFILRNSIAILMSWIANIKFGQESKYATLVFEKYNGLLVICIVFLGLLPYIASFYPCVISYDGSFQIGQFLGEFTFTDHHTPLVTIFYGYFAYISMNTNLGHFALFLPVLIQVSLYLISVWVVFDLMKELRTPNQLNWLCLAFFSLFPLFPIHLMTYSKDSLYFPLIIIFSAMIIKIIKFPKKYVKNFVFCCLFILVTILVCMIRKNGFIVLILTIPFVVLICKGFRTQIIIIFIVSVCVNNYSTNLFYNNGVKKVEMQLDTYTFMFQQTARYARDFPEDITTEEYQFLDTIFEYWKIPYDYNPRLADPVKRLLRLKDPTETFDWDKDLVLHDELNQYIDLWFNQLRKHPGTYLASLIEGSYGYYYPEIKEAYEGLGWYNTLNISKQFTYEDPANRLVLRKSIESMTYFMRDLPLLGTVFSIGLHTWLVILAFIYFTVTRKMKDIVSILPAVLTILICFVSPVSGYIRYALPIFAMTPLIIVLIWSAMQKEESL
ncbi:MAG: DUF6020 family protein [Anaerorhabdus sp.]|uniref:DUF6020 family protein n=1 Tax=Anaerorhabdus sp. TaxID=1872524 RepID=UPI002FC75550